VHRVVFDIETLGFPFESFDETQQEYLTKFARTEDERREALLRLNLYPFTAHLIAVGLLNPDTEKGVVLYAGDRSEETTSEDGHIQFVAGDEEEILRRFWDIITKYDQFITFNGRGFDCPFLMLRSMVLGIKPSRNLMPYRYESSVHCDLLEQLTYYGATRKFNLDFYCKAVGIESPKSRGITGLDLGALFAEKKFREIADYCLGDVRATAQLFTKWDQFLRNPGDSGGSDR